MTTSMARTSGQTTTPLLYIRGACLGVPEPHFCACSEPSSLSLGKHTVELFLAALKSLNLSLFMHYLLRLLSDLLLDFPTGALCFFIIWPYHVPSELTPQPSRFLWLFKTKKAHDCKEFIHI